MADLVISVSKVGYVPKEPQRGTLAEVFACEDTIKDIRSRLSEMLSSGVYSNLKDCDYDFIDRDEVIKRKITITIKVEDVPWKGSSKRNQK